VAPIRATEQQISKGKKMLAIAYVVLIRSHKLNTATSSRRLMIINLQKHTSLSLVFRTTNLTPAKPQISKFQVEKSGQVGFNVLRRLYSRALCQMSQFVRIHASVSYVCNTLSVEIAHGLF
jgi:hypothetical protein